MKKIFLAMSLFLILTGAAHAASPIILFTDILTGAKSGGEGSNGVYLSIYGRNFGSSQGGSTVTVGGVAPSQYKIWGSANDITTFLDKIVVQISPSTVTGNVIVTVGGVASNAVSFTVCTGNIYFVSPSGNDSNVGSFASPWLTPTKARTVAAAGDTVYFRAGTYTTVDNFSSVINCQGGGCQGTSSAYINFLGYPGETANIGDGTVTRAFYNWGNQVVQYMTLAEITWRATESTISCSNITTSAACNFLRIVENDTRSLGSGEGVDLEMPVANVSVFGNESQNNCSGGGCTFDQRAYSIYVGGYGAQSNVEIAWNDLHDNPFGKGIQVYGHSSIDTLTNLLIHDNWIYNNTMVGVNLGGCDGGCTEFVRSASYYNNLSWNNSNQADGSHKNYGSLEILSTESATGAINVYNNTFYKDSPSGSGFLAGAPITFAVVGPNSVVINNNIFYGSAGCPGYTYWDDSTASHTGGVTFSNNIYFNCTGTGPNGYKYGTGSITVNGDGHAINADPNMVNPGSNNFHLNSGSVAIGAGSATIFPAQDHDGLIRPSPPSIGAYEFSSFVPTTAPNIKLPLTATGVVGSPFSYQIVADQNPTSFGATNLPPPLGIDTTLGFISGIPSQAGGFPVGLSATNSVGTGTATLALTINAAPPPPPPPPTNYTINSTPASLTFSVSTGASATQPITINDTTPHALPFAVSSDSAWLSSPLSGVTKATNFPITVNSTGLTPGTYNGNIILTASGISNSPLKVPVALAVVSPPTAQQSVTITVCLNTQANCKTVTIPFP